MEREVKGKREGTKGYVLNIKILSKQRKGNDMGIRGNIVRISLGIQMLVIWGLLASREDNGTAFVTALLWTVIVDSVLIGRKRGQKQEKGRKCGEWGWRGIFMSRKANIVWYLLIMGMLMWTGFTGLYDVDAWMLGIFVTLGCLHGLDEIYKCAKLLEVYEKGVNVKGRFVEWVDVELETGTEESTEKRGVVLVMKTGEFLAGEDRIRVSRECAEELEKQKAKEGEEVGCI